MKEDYTFFSAFVLSPSSSVLPFSMQRVFMRVFIRDLKFYTFLNACIRYKYLNKIQLFQSKTFVYLHLLGIATTLIKMHCAYKTDRIDWPLTSHLQHFGKTGSHEDI